MLVRTHAGRCRGALRAARAKKSGGGRLSAGARDKTARADDLLRTRAPQHPTAGFTGTALKSGQTPVRAGCLQADYCRLVAPPARPAAHH